MWGLGRGVERRRNELVCRNRSHSLSDPAQAVGELMGRPQASTDKSMSHPDRDFLRWGQALLIFELPVSDWTGRYSQ